MMSYLKKKKFYIKGIRNINYKIERENNNSTKCFLRANFVGELAKPLNFQKKNFI